MTELFYQYFPKMRDLPPYIWTYFWIGVALTPFTMIGIHYLAKFLLWIGTTYSYRFLITTLKAGFPDDIKSAKVIERVDKRNGTKTG
jgi:hypothetical protein